MHLRAFALQRHRYGIRTVKLSPASGSVLNNVTFEKDLDVVITGDLKLSRQCGHSDAKANRVLGLTKRNFISFSKDIVLNLYKQLVRPHLDCRSGLDPFL